MFELLLADDDSANRYMLQYAFNELNKQVQVKFARDGEELLELLSDCDSVQHIKLVVLDMHMPGMSGMQVLEKMKTDPNVNSVPVIMFSAAIDPPDEMNCLRLGAQAVITKPHTIDGYLDTARHFLGLCGRQQIE